MSESYVECLVKAKGSVLFKILKFVLYALCAVSVASLMIGTGIIGVILTLAFGFGGYYLGMQADIEYEYLYLDKELTIDKVLAKTNRKRVGVYSVSKMEILAPIKSFRLDNYKNRQVKEKDYSIGYEEKPDRRFVFYYDGTEKIIISPSEEMIKVMRNANPIKVYAD